ncbi:MAG TPA: VOC family protein [Saprospiraceae bacterium]|nr:VOC family protein [Saprospiraceae bacterium]
MNAIGWVEVPVTDMGRAIRFYNTLFGWNLQENQLGPLTMAWFPWEQGGPGAAGSLVKNENYTPGTHGALVYFQSEDVSIQADRVENAGGKLLKGKTQISPDVGYMALAIDSEGNRIAFHSLQ